MKAKQLVDVLGDYRPKGYNNVREFLVSCRRRKAVDYVSKAISKKIIPKAKECMCVDCGKPAYCYDHRDYSKPSEIVPVCGSCQGFRGAGLPYPAATEVLIVLYKYELEKLLIKISNHVKSTEEEKLAADVYLGYLQRFIKETECSE